MVLLLQCSARRPTTWASYVGPFDNGWMSGFLCAIGYGGVVVAVFRQKTSYLASYVRPLDNVLDVWIPLCYRLWCCCCCRVPPEDQQPGHPTYDFCTVAGCLGPSVLSAMVLLLQTSARRATTWASYAACLGSSVFQAMVLLLLLFWRPPPEEQLPGHHTLHVWVSLCSRLWCCYCCCCCCRLPPEEQLLGHHTLHVWFSLFSGLWCCCCCCRVPPEEQLPGHHTAPGRVGQTVVRGRRSVRGHPQQHRRRGRAGDGAVGETQPQQPAQQAELCSGQ